MPRGVYKRKVKVMAHERKPRTSRAKSTKTMDIPKKFCVIGPKINPRVNFGDRKWFDDIVEAEGHAAAILRKAMQENNGTDRMYVVQIVRVVKPPEPVDQFDLFIVD